MTEVRIASVHVYVFLKYWIRKKRKNEDIVLPEEFKRVERDFDIFFLQSNCPYYEID